MLDEAGIKLMFPKDLTRPFARWLARSGAQMVRSRGQVPLRRYLCASVYRRSAVLGAQPRSIEEATFDIAWAKPALPLGAKNSGQRKAQGDAERAGLDEVAAAEHASALEAEVLKAILDGLATFDKWLCPRLHVALNNVALTQNVLSAFLGVAVPDDMTTEEGRSTLRLRHRLCNVIRKHVESAETTDPAQWKALKVELQKAVPQLPLPPKGLTLLRSLLDVVRSAKQKDVAPHVAEWCAAQAESAPAGSVASAALLRAQSAAEALGRTISFLREWGVSTTQPLHTDVFLWMPRHSSPYGTHAGGSVARENETAHCGFVFQVACTSSAGRRSRREAKYAASGKKAKARGAHARDIIAEGGRFDDLVHSLELRRSRSARIGAVGGRIIVSKVVDRVLAFERARRDAARASSSAALASSLPGGAHLVAMTDVVICSVGQGDDGDARNTAYYF